MKQTEYTHILRTNTMGFANTEALYPIKAEDVEAAEKRAASLNLMNDCSGCFVAPWDSFDARDRRRVGRMLRDMASFGYSYANVMHDAMVYDEGP